MMSQKYNFAGDHDHTATVSYTQSTIPSRLFNLWQLVVKTSPTKDIILMYVGSLSALPKPWYVCNGENGTVDIRDTIIGYSTGNAWGNIVTSDATAAQGSVTTNSDIHTHSGGYDISAESGAPGYHTNYTWSHTHTVSVAVGNYFPSSLNVAFIQYKG